MYEFYPLFLVGGVVGTLAGDDTIFVLMRDEAMAVSLVESIGKLID